MRREPMALTARDVMQAHVLSVSPDMTLAALEDFLVSKRIGGAPVVENDVLVGVVSRSDIVRTLSLVRSLSGVIAEGFEAEALPLPAELARQLSQRTVRDVMAAGPVTVSPETPIAEVARLLGARHIHRVLVTEGTRVLGVISTLDLVRRVADGTLREP